MKRRLAALTAFSALAVATTLGVAVPAQAQIPGYVKQGSYNWGDQCLGVGYYGQQQHTWSAYYCETITTSGATGPGLYNLWVLY